MVVRGTRPQLSVVPPIPCCQSNDQGGMKPAQALMRGMGLLRLHWQLIRLLSTSHPTLDFEHELHYFAADLSLEFRQLGRHPIGHLCLEQCHIDRRFDLARDLVRSAPVWQFRVSLLRDDACLLLCPSNCALDRLVQCHQRRSVPPDPGSASDFLAIARVVGPISSTPLFRRKSRLRLVFRSTDSRLLSSKLMPLPRCTNC